MDMMELLGGKTIKEVVILSLQVMVGLLGMDFVEEKFLPGFVITVFIVLGLSILRNYKRGQGITDKTALVKELIGIVVLEIIIWLIFAELSIIDYLPLFK